MRHPLHMTTDMIKVGVKNAVAGNRRFPFVLMLEPLYTCNLACLGCAKERHTGKLKDRLAVEDCLRAATLKGYVSPEDLAAARLLLRRLYPALSRLIADLRRRPDSPRRRTCGPRR